MYWVAMAMCEDPHLAEEVVQDTFVRLWEQKNDLSNIQNPHAYLATLVRNNLRDYYKHISVERAHRSMVEYHITSGNIEDFSDEEREAMIARARELVDSLPEGCRRIFIKAAVDGMKYSEIAESENISVNTVKTQLRIARKKLGNNNAALVILLLQLLKL